MPSRLIKDSIFSSPNFNRLSLEAQSHFYRLLLTADDHGCMEVTPAVVLGKCYPLMADNITAKQIKNWNAELNQQDIMRTWKQDGRIYGVFPQFAKHNRIRSLHRRKTPSPPDALLLRELSSSCAYNPIPEHEHDPKPKPKKDYPLEAINLASLLARKILSEYPNSNNLKGHNRKNTIILWANEIDAMNRIDKITWEDIEKVINWCWSPGCFWHENKIIRSAKKLRKHFEQMSMQMKDKGKSGGSTRKKDNDSFVRY